MILSSGSSRSEFSTYVVKSLYHFSLLVISSCSFSMVIRLASRLESTSSKSISFLFNRLFASSITDSLNPNFEEIAKALLFPGIPIKRRYVGLNVSTSNSQEAFSIRYNVWLP